MRWIKFIFLIGIFFLLVYSISMLFIDSSKNYIVEKEVNYPIDQVYNQFDDLQNLSQWSSYFFKNKNFHYTYFAPYQGNGASMHFQTTDKKKSGDITITKDEKLKKISYHILVSGENYPYIFDIKFTPLGKNKTKIISHITTPKRSFLRRFMNISFSFEDNILDDSNQSIVNLNNLLGNKIRKETQLTTIKYDSIIIENQTEKLLLGLNDNESNKNDALIKSIFTNYGKLVDYLTKDLEKKQDEFGDPTLITKSDNDKDSFTQYFLGFPVSKTQKIEGNYLYRKIAAGKKYVIYYKGNYNGRKKSVGMLLQRIKNDSLRNGNLEELFLEAPTEGVNVNLKLSLPAYK